MATRDPAQILSLVFDPATNALRISGGGGGGGGSSTFLGLTDAPDAYTGQGGKIVAVNAGGTGLEFILAPSGGGASTALQLTDVPDAYGTPGQTLAVNGAGTGLEWATPAVDTGIAAVVEDTAPALGGTLTVDGFGIAATGANDLSLALGTGTAKLSGGKGLQIAPATFTTTAPTALVIASETTATKDSSISLRKCSNTGTAELNFRRSRGTLSAPTPPQDGDVLAYLSFTGWTGSAYSNAGQIRVLATGDWTTTRTSYLEITADSNVTKVYSDRTEFAKPVALYAGTKLTYGVTTFRTFAVYNTSVNGSSANLYDQGSGVYDIPVPLNTSLVINLHAKGMRTDVTGEAAAYKLSCVATNVGGVVTVGPQLKSIVHEDDSLWDINVVASGGNVVIQVQGSSGKTVEFAAVVETF